MLGRLACTGLSKDAARFVETVKQVRALGFIIDDRLENVGQSRMSGRRLVAKATVGVDERPRIAAGEHVLLRLLERGCRIQDAS